MRLRVQSLALLSGLRVFTAVSCGVGCRCGSEPTLLWLWCRPTATAQILPLAWEPPYAVDAALKKTKRWKRKKKEEANRKKKRNKYEIQIYMTTCGRFPQLKSQGASIQTKVHPLPGPTALTAFPRPLQGWPGFPMTLPQKSVDWFLVSIYHVFFNQISGYCSFLSVCLSVCLSFLSSCHFLGSLPWHMEFHRLGV